MTHYLDIVIIMIDRELENIYYDFNLKICHDLL